ncbi:MAG: glycosyltransferase [Planctomycetales bacterium]|jgi:glycosyltransferase involved in cell wall biosynthesis
MLRSTDVVNESAAASIQRYRVDPLRVVLASTQVGWGGGEVYLTAIAEEFVNRGIDVTFLSRAGTELHRRVSDAGYAVKTIHGYGRNPFGIWRLRRWLRSLGPAILHCNDSHALSSAGLAALGLKSISVVAMRHTMFAIHSVAKYRRLSDRIICVSNAVADGCRKQGISDKWLRVVHSGIDEPNVAPVDVEKLRREFLPTDQHRLIVAVGNLLPGKGHQTLIQAAALLKAQGIRAITVIAGEGSQRAKLEAQIESLSLQDDVKLLGFRNDADTVLAAADVVTHPAFEEGLCLTVAAAMMLDRPIVASACGGLSDVLGLDPRMEADGPFGIIVEPGDHKRLSEALRTQLTSPPASDVLKTARVFATRRFTTPSVVDGTVAVYQNMLQRRPHVA